MSYTIGTYNIEAAHLFWQDAGEPSYGKYAVLFIVGGGQVHAYEGDSLWDDMITSGIPLRPVPPTHLHEYDDIEGKWVVPIENLSSYHSFIINEIREYRRTRTILSPDVKKIFDEGGTNEEELGIKPDDDSLTAVLKKAKKSEWNTSATEVMFRFNSFTPKGATDIGNRIVPIGFLQEFYDEMDNVNQSYRDAEEAVLSTHGNVEIFNSPEDAKQAFDDYINNL